MASRMIGRAPCPECGFGAAHVKRSEKCLYRFCPDCQAQYVTRNARQEKDLLDKTRLIDAPAATGSPDEPAAPAASAPATASASPSAPEPQAATASAPSATTPEKPKRRGLFV